jgi:hypothetical protein
MKTIKTFEQFVSEAEALKAEDSKVYVEDVSLENGTVIKAVEVLGAIAASATEKEFENYFFDSYGQDAFTTEEMSTLKTFFNQSKKEDNEEEVEKEKEESKGEDGAEGGEEEDPSAGLEGL